LKKNLLGNFGIASVVAGMAALAIPFSGHLPRRDWDDRERTRFMVVVAGVATGGFTVASMWQPISMENVLVLYSVVTAFVVPVAISWGISYLASPLKREVAWNLALLVFVLMIAQGFRNPDPFHPDARDTERWASLESEIARYGPKQKAWISLHGSAYGGALDEPTWVHRGALCDFVGGYFGESTPYAVPQSLFDRVDEQYWDVIVVSAFDEGMQEFLAGRYMPDPNSDGLRLPAFAGYGGAWEHYWIPLPNRDATFQRSDPDGACASK
jgi:hypothetical protein